MFFKNFLKFLKAIIFLIFLNAMIIPGFRRGIKLFWVVGWRLWPGAQPFQLIWPKISPQKFATNTFFNTGANQSGDNCACQGAKTWPTANQVGLEKGKRSPYWSELIWQMKKIKGSRGQKRWKHPTIGSKRSEARFESCPGKTPGVKVRQKFATRWKKCNFSWEISKASLLCTRNIIQRIRSTNYHFYLKWWTKLFVLVRYFYFSLFNNHLNWEPVLKLPGFRTH